MGLLRRFTTNGAVAYGVGDLGETQTAGRGRNTVWPAMTLSSLSIMGMQEFDDMVRYLVLKVMMHYNGHYWSEKRPESESMTMQFIVV